MRKSLLKLALCDFKLVFLSYFLGFFGQIVSTSGQQNSANGFIISVTRKTAMGVTCGLNATLLVDAEA